MRAPVVALPLLTAAVLAASAAAQTAPLALEASTQRPGRIGLELSGPAGAQVDVVETTNATARPIGRVTLDDQGVAAIPAAATWVCETRDRTFSAQGTAPDGTVLSAQAEAHTPSCARRYRLVVTPRRPRAGKPARVTVRDRFRLPVTGRVCASGPAQLTACGDVERRRARLTLARAGRWTLTYANARRTVTVRRAGRLRLLATGDSMIQIIDGFLKSRLAGRRVGVRSDARISSGLSKPAFFNWPRHARGQVRSARPDLTVVFIGANDGFPFGDVGCCGKAWQRRYARVASGMMRTYEQGGRGTVFWCLLPAPRGGDFRRVFVAVNRAIRRAARRHRGTVHLVDLPRTFTPGFRFRQTLDGRSVRQPDGVHLNVAGASIAANLIIRALGRAGQL